VQGGIDGERPWSRRKFCCRKQPCIIKCLCVFGIWLWVDFIRTKRCGGVYIVYWMSGSGAGDAPPGP